MADALQGGADYSQLVTSFKIRRSSNIFAFKALPPVIITLLIAGFVFLLDIDSLEVRLATAISALLTEVFLQIESHHNIPSNADYLTLADA